MPRSIARPMRSDEWGDPEWDGSVVYDPPEVDRRTFRELVHAGTHYTGYANQWEAGIHCTRGRVLVSGDDGRWYVMTPNNARKYYRQCDEKEREQCQL